MLKLSSVDTGVCELFVKLESQNPGGSIKDRPVKYILDVYERDGYLKKGNTIIEATSGNTGISLAMMCAERGYKCIIVMPIDMSEERKKMIRRSNERLKMLDLMGKQRQLKLQQDLQRLEAEKNAERLRQQRITAQHAQ